VSQSLRTMVLYSTGGGVGGAFSSCCYPSLVQMLEVRSLSFEIMLMIHEVEQAVAVERGSTKEGTYCRW
jgi:hypothetical protein